MQPIETALITGASSGIGRALADALATPGVTLHLSGRDVARLEATVRACEAKGATVHPSTVDVRDAAAMARWIGQAGRLDLVIANAGIAAGNQGGETETDEQTRAIFATNLDGALNTMLPAIDIMARQPADARGVRGRIAAIASIAAFIALPNASAYSASKAALDRWTMARAPSAARLGVQLNSVCPGYVRSAITARNRFPMPGFMEADRAAALILLGMVSGQTRIVFPRLLGLAGRAGGLLPPRLLGRLVHHD